MEDVFEAFIGAVYMDFQTDEDTVTLSPNLVKAFMPLSGSGFFIAEQWIVAILEKYVDFAELICAKSNYKDMLVRYMQHAFQDAPRFFEVNVRMIDSKSHQKEFTYCVKDRNGATIGTSKGTSKKEAENLAAKRALEYYGQPIA